MFPRRAVGSVVGIGGMAGAIGGMLIATATGHLLQLTGSYLADLRDRGLRLPGRPRRHPRARAAARARRARRGSDRHEAVHPRRLPARDATSRASSTTARRRRPADHRLPLPPAGGADRAPTTASARITEIWLDGDHYKWRAMRANGVAERYCTGDASDWEKFEAWARTVPATLRNPLYHWTHLELQQPVRDRRSCSTRTTARRDLRPLQRAPAASRASRPRACCAQFKVAVVCTTDDPADSLAHHARARRSAPIRDTRVVSDLAPRPRRWPSTTRRRSTPGSTALEAAAGRLDRAARSDFWTRSSGATPPSTTPGAAPPITGWSRSTPKTSRDAEVAATFDRCARGAAVDADEARALQVGPAAPPAPSWTTRAAGCSSSTSARCATRTRACAGGWARTPASTPSATSRWRGRWPASSTASTRPTSSRRPSSTTSTRATTSSSPP